MRGAMRPHGTATPMARRITQISGDRVVPRGSRHSPVGDSRPPTAAPWYAQLTPEYYKLFMKGKGRGGAAEISTLGAQQAPVQPSDGAAAELDQESPGRQVPSVEASPQVGDLLSGVLGDREGPGALSSPQRGTMPGGVVGGPGPRTHSERHAPSTSYLWAVGCMDELSTAEVDKKDEEPDSAPLAPARKPVATVTPLPYAHSHGSTNVAQTRFRHARLSLTGLPAVFCGCRSALRHFDYTIHGFMANPMWRVYRPFLYKAIAANPAIPTSALSKYYDEHIRSYAVFKQRGNNYYGTLSLISVKHMLEVRQSPLAANCSPA